MPIFKRSLSEFLFRRFMLKHYSTNMLVDINLEAKRDSLDYVRQNMAEAPYYEQHSELVDHVLDQVDADGLYLEFGVGRGKSIRWIGSKVSGPVHGFDSFKGLPENWNGKGFGAFAQKKLPKVPKNVVLHIGLFDATLPDFLSTHSGSVAFMHVDCDLYSSTCTIFDKLGDRLRPGTIVLFDEYFNYYRWQEHEFRSFQEFIARSGAEYEYIAFSVTSHQVAVRILNNPLFSV